MNTTPADQPIMWLPTMDIFLSHWFGSHAEARAFRESEGGFLFPYQRQYFVASGDAVRYLGPDPLSPDWALIGFDWVQPADRAAWERLRLRREIAA